METGALRRLLVDTRPLRESVAFRRLWLGSSLSAVGSRMTAFAVVLQVYRLTHSSFAVGSLGLAMAVPAIVVACAGGMAADRVDPRRLVLLATGCLAGVSVVLALQALAGIGLVWLLYALVALQSLLNAIEAPARRTFLPRLLPPEQIPAGAALNMLAFHFGVTAGPALAGLIAARGGLEACYLVDAISFAAALYGCFRLPPMPAAPGAPGPGLLALWQTMRVVLRHRILAGAFLADMNATVLGMPVALFPAINADHFGGSAQTKSADARGWRTATPMDRWISAQTLGLLGAAPAAGGVLASAISGPVGRVSRQGRAILFAGAVWGMSLAAFGLARSLWLALGLLVLAGAADLYAVVCRTAVVQVAAPEGHRGRVSALEYIVGEGCPQVGNFRAGAIASLTSASLAATSGGLSTVVGVALIGLAMPAFMRYEARSRAAADAP